SKFKMNPPIKTRKIGRPRVNRRRAYDEPVTEKKNRRCSTCKSSGHYKSTCAGGDVAANTKGKRPRAEVDGTDYSCTNLDSSQASKVRGNSRKTMKTGGESSAAPARGGSAKVGSAKVVKGTGSAVKSSKAKKKLGH
ncbi:hypothetical protein MKW94_010655, partial [Papaver nudicaule]|nr:hypothetical protein [Papaver nudicaule]